MLPDAGRRVRIRRPSGTGILRSAVTGGIDVTTRTTTHSGGRRTPLYAGNASIAPSRRWNPVRALDRPAVALRRAVRRAGARRAAQGRTERHVARPSPPPDAHRPPYRILDQRMDPGSPGPAPVPGSESALVGLGVLSAVPAAAAGLSDWSDTDGGSRRVGLVHAAANATATAPAISLPGWRGVAATSGAASRSAWLGRPRPPSAAIWAGTWCKAAGSESTRAARRSSDRLDPGHIEREPDEQPQRGDADGFAVAVFRDQSRLGALGAICPHRGAPLDEGTIVDGCLECPWHGSRFRLRDGALVRGPAATPVVAFDVRSEMT